MTLTLLAELDAVLELNLEIVNVPRCVEALPDFLTDEGQDLLGYGFVILTPDLRK